MISPQAPPTAAQIPMLAQEARFCVEKIKVHMGGARALLLELYERRGWEVLGYSSWRECVVTEFAQSQTHLYRQLQAGLTERELSPNGEIGRIPESHLRELASVPASERAEVWQQAQERSGNGRVTAADVRHVADEREGAWWDEQRIAAARFEEAERLQQLKMGQSNRPPLMGYGHSDHFQTDRASVLPLLPYLPAGATIWECAWGRGQLAEVLREAGHPVIGSDLAGGQDFLRWAPAEAWDLIVTNPPFSLKDAFLARAYDLGRPFGLLLPLTALEGRERQQLYERHGVELLVLPRRPEFTTPSGRVGGGYFSCAWYTWGLRLPRQLTFALEETGETEEAEEVPA